MTTHENPDATRLQAEEQRVVFPTAVLGRVANVASGQVQIPGREGEEGPVAGTTVVDEYRDSLVESLTEGLPPAEKEEAVLVILGNLERKLALADARREHLRSTDRLIRKIPAGAHQGQES